MSVTAALLGKVGDGSTVCWDVKWDFHSNVSAYKWASPTDLEGTHQGQEERKQRGRRNVQSSQLVLQEAGAECNFCSLESFRCEPEKNEFLSCFIFPFLLLFLASCFENPVCSSINIQSSLLPKRMMTCLLE